MARPSSPALALPALAAALLLASATAGCGSSQTKAPATSKSGTQTSSLASLSASASKSAGASSAGKSKKPESRIEFTRGKEPKWATVPASMPAKSGTIQIAYRYIAIDPDAIKVKAGSTVRWTNYDEIPHNVTSIGKSPTKLASGNFTAGRTYQVTLAKPGTIHYESTNFPTTMNGTIVVVP
jgi:plastocyanin